MGTGTPKSGDSCWHLSQLPSPPSASTDCGLPLFSGNPNFWFAMLYIVASPSLALILSDWPTAAAHHFLDFIHNTSFTLNGIISSLVALFIFWSWHFRRN